MSEVTTQFDRAKAEAFAERMVGVLNTGALALMTSLGHRTGLFDTMATLPPSTSQQIAEAATLNERYVREWLGAMVTGRIVEYDPDGQTYRLPPEHATCVTRAAGGNNLAQTIQFLPMMGGVEDGIVDSFRHGGGVPYSAFGRFHEVMAEESLQTVCANLIDLALPLIDGLVPRLEAGIDVLDVGCGRGRAVCLMAEHFPNSRFAGYDFSEEAIANAREEAARRGLKNARFEVKDAAAVDEAGRYDFVTTFDAVHDQADPAGMLAAVSSALKEDGVYLMQDIAASSHLHENLDHMLGPFLYTISTMHCMTVSLALDGVGLGTVWGKQKAVEMLGAAGFAHVDVQQLEGDVMNYWYVCRKH